MSRSVLPRGLLVNFAALLGGRGLALAANLFWLLATARLYSTREFAILALASICQAALEATKGLGLGTLLLRELSPRRIRSYLYWTAITLLAPATLLWWLAPMARPGIVWSVPHWTQALFLALAQSIATSFLLAIQAQGRFGSQAAWNAWFSLAQRAVPAVLAIALELSFAEFLSLSTILCALSLVPAAVELARWLRLSPPAEKLSEFWPHSRHFYGGGLLRFAATQFDQIAVAAFLRPEMLAPYFVLRRLYSLVIVFLEASFDTFIPILAARAKSDRAAALRLYAGMRESAAFAATFCACAAAANAWLFDPVLIPLFALCILAFTAYASAAVRENILGDPALALRATAVSAATNIAAMPILAPLAGVHALPAALALSLFLGARAAAPLSPQTTERVAAIAACGIAGYLLPAPFANLLIPIWLLRERANPILHRLCHA